MVVVVGGGTVVVVDDSWERDFVGEDVVEGGAAGAGGLTLKSVPVRTVTSAPEAEVDELLEELGAKPMITWPEIDRATA